MENHIYLVQGLVLDVSEMENKFFLIKYMIER